MSISAMSRTVGPTKALPPGRYGISGLLASEWTKLRSLRSTMWTLGLTVVLGIGISALATAETRAHWSSMSLGSRLSFDPTSTSLIGVFFGQLTIGVLGVLVMTGEYGSGTIRATLPVSTIPWASNRLSGPLQCPNSRPDKPTTEANSARRFNRGK